MDHAVATDGVGVAGAAGSRLLPDRRLVKLAADGSQAAFAEIFRRHHQALYRYSLSIVASEQDARDAVQATMVKLLDSLPGEQRNIALKPWLFKIAHNEAISIIRRRRESSLEAEPEQQVAEDSGELRDRTRDLLADLSALPDRQRSAVVLRELSGLSHQEIGFALGVSQAAAKQAVYEGRVALQQAEAGREMDCSTAQQMLSANDRRILRGRKISAHLRTCSGCRDFEKSIKARRSELAGLAPLSVVASKEILASIFGSGAGPGGGLGALGISGAVKALSGATAAQVATSAAVIAGAGVAITAGGVVGGKPDPASAGASEGSRGVLAAAVESPPSPEPKTELATADNSPGAAIARALGQAGGRIADGRPDIGSGSRGNAFDPPGTPPRGGGPGTAMPDGAGGGDTGSPAGGDGPEGNGPPGQSPGGPPGKGPDGNGPPGQSPDGPPGNGPGGNGPPGQSPGGPPGNGPGGNGPPGQSPDGPPGNGPGGNGPPGQSPGGPPGNGPGGNGPPGQSPGLPPGPPSTPPGQAPGGPPGKLPGGLPGKVPNGAGPPGLPPGGSPGKAQK